MAHLTRDCGEVGGTFTDGCGFRNLSSQSHVFEPETM